MKNGKNKTRVKNSVDEEIEQSLIPFEGILGDTPEMRIIEYMMALSRYSFSISELALTVNMSIRETKSIMAKFEQWNMVKKIRHNEYRINSDSKLIRAIIGLNETIIGELFSDEPRKIKFKFLASEWGN